MHPIRVQRAGTLFHLYVMTFSYSGIRRAVKAGLSDSSSFWTQIFLSLWGNEQTTITIFQNKMSHFFFLSSVWICKLLKLVNEEKLRPVIPQATKQGSKRKRDE